MLKVNLSIIMYIMKNGYLFWDFETKCKPGKTNMHDYISKMDKQNK